MYSQHRCACSSFVLVPFKEKCFVNEYDIYFVLSSLRNERKSSKKTDCQKPSEKEKKEVGTGQF